MPNNTPEIETELMEFMGEVQWYAKHVPTGLMTNGDSEQDARENLREMLGTEEEQQELIDALKN